MDLLIATKNVHKLRELKAILRIPKIDIYSLHSFPDYIPPEEIGETFEENAILKALHAASALNKWVIADDSGLLVPALGGKPGVRSRRYAGPLATDADNRKKLLDEMRDLHGIARSASYQCVLALAHPERIEKVVKGVCEGIILTEERGSNGFGYDSLFLEHGYNQTFAQLTEETKNKISHRRKAADKLVFSLEILLAGQPLVQ